MTREKTVKKTVSGVNLRNFIQPSYRNLIIGFAILAIILVIAILYFAFSQATIIITPSFQEQKVGFAVQLVDKNLASQDSLISGRLLGEVKETIVEATQEFPATSYKVTDTKAGGEITIINNYSKNQPLIATTRFLTPNGKLYRLVSGVTIPAGGKITAQVLADQRGEEYEIGPTTLTIPGLWEGLQNKIYGETQGFTRQTFTKYVASQNDINEASDSLKEQLINQAIPELSQGLLSNQIITSDDLVIETIKYSVSTEPETEVESFTITMSLGVKAAIFNQEELKQAASQNLPEIYKQNNYLVKVDSEKFNYEITLLDENPENLIAQIKGDYPIAVASVEIDKTALKGVSKKEAEEYLLNLGNIEKVSIRLPFWTKYLPNLVDHIDIQIKQ